jgi:methionyl-tRNA synthetase
VVAAGHLVGNHTHDHARLTTVTPTQALEQIWVRVRRLNRYVEETAPWKLAKDETKADELHRALRSLAEGLRVVTVLLVPYIPESTEKLLASLGTPDTALEGARYGAHPGGQPVEKIAPLFPKPE